MRSRVAKGEIAGGVPNRLEERVWREILPLPVTMYEPTFQGAPTERTEIRVMFDRDALFIGAELFDTDPRQLLGNQMLRDGALDGDDRLMQRFGLSGRSLREAVERSLRPGELEVWVMDADGSNQRQVYGVSGVNPYGVGFDPVGVAHPVGLPFPVDQHRPDLLGPRRNHDRSAQSERSFGRLAFVLPPSSPIVPLRLEQSPASRASLKLGSCPLQPLADENAGSSA